MADSATPLGDPLLKARTHIGASGAAGLAIDTSLVAATYGAILRSLGPPALCRQILKCPPRLRDENIRWNRGAWRGHVLRFRDDHVFHGPPRRLVLRRKPGFRRLPFGPFFRDHNAVVIVQDVAGLRRCRCRQRRRQNDHHDHRGFAHHCHRIKPPHDLASWPLIQSPVVTCKRPLGVAQPQKQSCHSRRHSRTNEA